MRREIEARRARGGEPLALPVGMRLHGKGGASLPELAGGLLLEASSRFPNRESGLCADGLFASLAGTLPEAFLPISRIGKDAALYPLPPERVKGQRGRPRKKGMGLPSLERTATSAEEEDWRLVEAGERGKARKRLALCF